MNDSDVAGPPAPLRPVARGERMELIDILRGFAILGILLVNHQLFFAPIYVQISSIKWWHAGIDRATETLIVFLAQGKFYTLFSFLFGVGLAIQAERARARGRQIYAFLGRRLLGLLLIGLVHATMIWFGDILVLYSVTGFVLLLFIRSGCKPRTMLVWSLVLMLAVLLVTAGFVGLLTVASMFEEAAVEIEEAFAQNEQEMAWAIEEARTVYATGSVGEIIGVRLVQWTMMLQMSFFFLPQILAIFLLGLAVGRLGWFSDPEELATRARRWLPWLLPVGLVSNAVLAWCTAVVNQAQPSPLMLLQQTVFLLGTPALCFSYVAIIVLLYRSGGWRRRLSWLAPVGRMALTNYLTHSLVFTFMANSYGFGLYGQMRPSTGLLMTLAMFALQIPFSSWWLSRYRFGPVEWLWRSWTYGRWQPLRGAAGSA